MEEKIYQKLLEKLGKTSLSERTIRAKAARLAKKITKDEELTDEAIQDSIDDLKDLEGQINHEVKDKVDQYKKENSSKKTKKGDDDEDNDDKDGKRGGASDSNALYETRIKALEDKIAASEKERLEEIKRIKVENLTNSVRTSLSNSGCNDADILELAMAKNVIDAEKSIEDNASVVRSWYDEKISSRVKSGIMPQGAVVVPVSNISEEDRITAAKARSARADKLMNKLN